MQNVSNIIKWYKKNFRNLPWRETKDPYKIWISEVILQQTQVVTGLAYYQRFIEKFPDIKALAMADSEQVLKLWQGLGYYSRARNLHKAAMLIVNEFGAEFPDNYKQLIAIPGIGDYTASAILSFAYGKPYPVLDGNVFRVISRLYDIDRPIDEAKNRQIFKDVLNQMIDNTDPILFNNAMMELGATLCRPDKPLCTECPLELSCLSRKLGNQNQRPVKSKKIKRKSRYFNYFFIRYNDGFYFVKRDDKDIWKNLYELPMYESDKELSGLEEAVLFFKSNICMTDPELFERKISFKHVLTHQDLYASFWIFRLNKKPTFLIKDCVRVDEKNYTKFPVSALTEKFLLSL